ncbi:dihydropteroate synthase [Friedmanniella endophytica]|uniref:Dihydropteroate synthase n=1 Tax=Microlunatus kandeliicorticis TaxID=1759536 RepID=A0A7W3IV91_9ACTN|nr:dihydropteroate synthase [Microlunatus kandeliicorticis]MBA8795887.1 dihydropteroate synthase [Microlunatus kandeliicorticis]
MAAPDVDLQTSLRPSAPELPDPPDRLRLGHRTFPRTQPLVMAIVNRTRDSFYDAGATFDLGPALERVAAVAADGADIVDIGGVKAGPGDVVDEAEEIRRVTGMVAAVRASHPELVVSVDTWRSSVAREACRAGADLLNDVWAGHDPELAGVAAEFDVALVCAHTGGLAPRTGPFRTGYDDLLGDVVGGVVGLARTALAAGVASDSIVLDPAHDFGKNTWQSLEVTRRLDELTGLGWPVLVSVSNKDFVGETLDLPLDQRREGTLAATAVCAWHGAQIHRVHDVAGTRRVVDFVAAVRGDQPPARTVRGLA